MKQASTTEDWRIVRNALEDMRDTFEDLAVKLDWQETLVNAYNIDYEEIQNMYETLNKLVDASNLIYKNLSNS